MRDFAKDCSALALNTATLGHNLDGYGAGWSTNQIIDACAARGFGGITFWRREIGDQADAIGRAWWDLSLEAELARAGKNRIAGFHLCDWLAQTTDVLLDRGMMGDGVADLRTLRAAVENAGYNGYCEVEIFSANNWWQRDPNTVLDIVVERFQSVC